MTDYKREEFDRQFRHSLLKDLWEAWCAGIDAAAKASEAGQQADKEPQVMARVYHADDHSEPVRAVLNSVGRKLPDGTALYDHPAPAPAPAVPEMHNIRKVYRDSDQSVRVLLSSCRAASAFERALSAQEQAK